MGWSIGYDEHWKRDIGYGVPAYCDHPGCMAEIDRGLAYVCCNDEPYGGDKGCGRYYCDQHATGLLSRCRHKRDGYLSPDRPEWIAHKLTHESWQQWRDENPEEVAALATPEGATGEGE
jgi:hypothetical protein